MDNSNTTTSIPAVPTIKENLKNLILSGLGEKYMAESCQDRIQTTNSYQSIALGEQVTSGFRTGRTEYLNMIQFQNKKVLDLGCNLGELSRMARARGAWLVDGFEYDRYFLEIGRAVNAYNDVTRVSLYQRDITNPAIYTEHYDVVMAFSVFIYLADVVDKLAEITDELLLVETHRLDDNLDSVYLKPIGKYFPYHRILGHTEWGTVVDPTVQRAVIAFAKTPELLAAAFKPSAVENKISSKSVEIEIDVHRSVQWFNAFFENFKYESPEALLKAVDEIDLHLDPASQFANAASAMSGWLYWLLYIRGYLEHRKSGNLTEDNVYYHYLTRYFGPQNRDPGLGKVLGDNQLAKTRVLQRFRDFQIFREACAQGSQDVKEYEPVALFPSSANVDVKQLFTVGSDVSLNAGVDGYHRLFLARLFGFSKLRARIVESGKPCASVESGGEQVPSQAFAQNGTVPIRATLGALEAVSNSEIMGWAWSPENPNTPVDVEIMDSGKVLAVVRADQRRQDLKRLGYGNGEHQFTIPPPDSLKDGKLHLVSARITHSKAELTNSPVAFSFRAAKPALGRLESVTASEISGWAWNPAEPDSSVTVEILEGDSLLATAKADIYREDLKRGGSGNGQHRFRVQLPAVLKDGKSHLIRAQIVGSKAELANSPLQVTIPTPKLELGRLENVSSSEISGWAWNPSAPDSPVSVEIYSDDTDIGTVVADLYRPDLKSSGLGNGNHQFRFPLPTSLKDGKPHLVRARIAQTTVELSNSPLTFCLSRPALELGRLEHVSRTEISGWAWNPTTPDSSVTVEIINGGDILANVKADIYREDLKRAGFGNGRYGFRLPVPIGKLKHKKISVTARIRDTNSLLPVASNSPRK